MKISDLASLTANMRVEDKMRVYLVSYLAVSSTDDPDDPSKQYSIFHHTPALIESQSIGMAMEQAKQEIESIWPKSEGWKLRNISIEPLPPSSLELLAQYWVGGLLAREINPPETGVNITVDSDEPVSRILINPDAPPS